MEDEKSGKRIYIKAFDIHDVDSTAIDSSMFPSSFNGDFFTRSNDNAKACKNGAVGAVCYTSQEYRQTLLKNPGKYQLPCDLGDIRITIKAYLAPISMAILGKVTRDEHNNTSVAAETFDFDGVNYDFLWYITDSNLSTFDQLNKWYLRALSIVNNGGEGGSSLKLKDPPPF